MGNALVVGLVEQMVAPKMMIQDLGLEQFCFICHTKL